ncbi:MAG: DUF3341 domain-containing protein [Gemmatimonadales bacterium]|nr:DUF3341 domain-containing protein [Gemmatimonadales bacterium]
MAERMVPGVLGHYEHMDAALETIEAFRTQGRKDLVVYVSHPNHEIEHALHEPISPVRRVTLVAGLTGTTAGFSLAIYTNGLDWPLLVGGKAPISPQAFVVLGFELTVLIGALSTVFAVIAFSFLQHRKGVLYDERFTDDRIGIFVPSAGAEQDKVASLMTEIGAVEVTRA